MYTVTSLPLESRTRAILRSAEFGFFGVIVLTCRHTPRFCGHASSTGDLVRRFWTTRGLRTSWLIVGMSGSGNEGEHSRCGRGAVKLGLERNGPLRRGR